jgi:hypothetical protein
MCHEDAETAAARGLEGFRFFGFALAHYYFAGSHVPGRLSVWDAFRQAPPLPPAPAGGIGTPDQVRATLEQFEATGVDQVVFIQQGGRNRHEHICESLELFAARVLPGFKERQEAHERRKAEALAPWVARALERMPPLEQLAEVPEVDSYPIAMQKAGIDMEELMRREGPGIRLAKSLGH